MPCEANRFLADHVSLLCRSYNRWTGKRLVPAELGDVEAARFLFEAPFAVLSHDTADDPLFNYANKKAMELFEMDWQDITALPSRLSAEPVNQEKRLQLLQQVAEHGFVEGYSGIRISGNGRRFMIENTVIWNLIDEGGHEAGQAAMFDRWRFL